MADTPANGNGARFVTWAMVFMVLAIVGGTLGSSWWFANLYYGLGERVTRLEERQSAMRDLIDRMRTAP